VEWREPSADVYNKAVTFGFAMQRQAKNVVFALQHRSFCITSVQALLCSMTKMPSQKAAVKYHRTGKSIFQARDASTSGTMKE
jgi:hypothetical protein